MENHTTKVCMVLELKSQSSPVLCGFSWPVFGFPPWPISCHMAAISHHFLHILPLFVMYGGILAHHHDSPSAINNTGPLLLILVFESQCSPTNLNRISE